MNSIVCGTPLAEASLAANFCAHEMPITLDRPRSILSVSQGEFLVFERGSSSVIDVFDTNNDGLPDTTVNTKASGGNHGLAHHEGYLYISSDSTVWRWKYKLGTNTVEEASQQVVVNNINQDGQGGAPQGHTTRTLAFDDEGRLYVSVGSNRNVDPDSHRSRIRRFEIDDDSTFPLDFQLGLVFADGLRNEVGLAFDRHGVLWGVENSADNLMRDDLGGDIHNDNPAEELNRFPEESIGANFGYPECWTEYNLGEAGMGRGTAWAWPSELFDISDDECRADRIAPELAMQAHSAPLGIVFYNYTSTWPDGCNGAFPETMDGHAFIAFHGSWNRDVPTGYKVVSVPMTSDGMVEAPEPLDLLRHESPDAQWSSGYRPVDVDFDECGRLLVTSDGSGGRGSNVVRIAYGEESCCGDASEGLDDGEEVVTSNPSPVMTTTTTTVSPNTAAPTTAAPATAAPTTAAPTTRQPVGNIAFPTRRRRQPGRIRDVFDIPEKMTEEEEEREQQRESFIQKLFDGLFGR